MQETPARRHFLRFGLTGQRPFSTLPPLKKL